MKTLELALGLRILHMINRHHIEDPIKAEAIAEACGLPQDADRQRLVASYAVELAKEGFGVCSGANGYYYARTEQEFRDHWEKERKRAVSRLTTRRDAIRNFPNAPELFDQGEAA